MVKSGTRLSDKTLKTKNLATKIILEGRDTECSSWKTKNGTRTGYEAVVGVSYSGERETHIPLIQKLQTKCDQ